MKLNMIDKFLMQREERVKYQQDLLLENKNKTLVTIKINYPGTEKSNYILDDIIKIITDEVITYYGLFVVFKRCYKTLEGSIVHLLFDLDYIKVKNIMIDIEQNHILGRCADLDVYTLKNNKVIAISRKDLNISPRKCFICDSNAKICSRSQNHSIEEIKLYFEKKYEEYLNHIKLRDKVSKKMSNRALKAMISEVSTYPCFGLVSPISSGSHKDMDYYTFLDSSFCIVPYLEKMSKYSYTYHDEKYIFNLIREIGKEAEDKMFMATNNVNTHKGMIFLLGIVIASTSKVIYNGGKFIDINTTIKNMTKDILDDFKQIDYKIKNNKKLTHGERLYIEYGFEGIRGQVKNGLDFIFNDVIYEYLESNLSKNDLYSHTLLRLMSIVDDSTIVYRHGISVLDKVKKDSIYILDKGGMNSEEGRRLCFELENEYIKKGISPGASADLLAVVIFLSYAKKYIK